MGRSEQSGPPGVLAWKATWPRSAGWTLSLLPLIAAGVVSGPGCSPPEASDVEVGDHAEGDHGARSTFEIRESEEGLEVRDGGQVVLHYQRTLKDLDGRYARSNYVHPLMSLDGDVLTEDFPEDHLHQRGVFWAWHQLWDGEERLGDGWTLEDFTTEVKRVAARVTDRSAHLDAEVDWRSPRFRDGEPFLEETTAITVHPIEDDARAIDFKIALRAVAPGIRIGGSEDPKGYGGFSARVRMPEGLVFTGEGGAVTPEELQVAAGPWVDVSAPYGAGGEVSGVSILTHPSSPGFPQQWILRQTGSMQNPVFPGRDPVGVPADRSIVLRYRLVVHRGAATAADVGRWQADYAGQ